jgi:16S rRNA G527 N7-methylase RsmG
VLKILSPETEVILGEVRPKRTRFLQQVIDELGLTGRAGICAPHWPAVSA